MSLILFVSISVGSIVAYEMYLSYQRLGKMETKNLEIEKVSQEILLPKEEKNITRRKKHNTNNRRNNKYSSWDIKNKKHRNINIWSR